MEGKGQGIFWFGGGEVVEGGFKVLPFSFDFGQKLGKTLAVDFWKKLGKTLGKQDRPK